MTKIRKFKIGDKVKCVAGAPKGHKGVVIAIVGDEFPYGVEFDKNYDGNGSWCDENQLEYDDVFKIGDKVRYIGTWQPLNNSVGTIVHINNPNSFAVAFKNFKGHTCSGHIPTANGWWCPLSELELIEDTKKEITEPIRDPETGSLSCCLDEVPVVPERYFDAHYGGDVQPIELMQMILTPEQFIGFLMGNIIKYSMRCGKKDAPEKELTKIRRYKTWLDQARNGEIINPRV